MVDLMAEQQVTIDRLQDKVEAAERYYNQQIAHLQDTIKSFNDQIDKRFYGLNGFKETFLE